MLKLFLAISSLLFLLAISASAQPKFEQQTIDNNVAIGYGLAIGDVDGDGKPDILLADKKQFVWYRNGDWKRFVMIDSLTQHDNVCLAVRDLDGDGKEEVAVGAQWNPSETANAANSGSVHYLLRPEDPTQQWKALTLHNEPTVHRMQWVKSAQGTFSLVVAPLHGRGNRGGEGEGAKLLAYRFPKDVYGKWQIDTLEKSMHLTHNFDVAEKENNSLIYLGGKEGIMIIDPSSGAVQKAPAKTKGVGELRVGKTAEGKQLIASIEPMHGNELVVYAGDRWERSVLDSNLKEGHALAVGDLLNTGNHQIVAGWRNPNSEGKVGIRLYMPKDKQGRKWNFVWVDENEMACEDLKLADLDGDGRLDIIATGRATHNLKIYWNKSGQ